MGRTALATLILCAAACPGLAQARSVAAIEDLIANARPGDTIRVPAGVYHGRLVIDTPITLVAELDAVIDGLGEGTVVTIEADRVELEGLVIRGGAASMTREPAGIIAQGVHSASLIGNRLEDVLFGIDLRNAPSSIVRGNTIVGMDLETGRRGDGIRLWWSNDCLIESNTISRSRDMVFWYSERLEIVGNTVTGSRYGLHFMYSHDTLIRGNRLEQNSVGVYLMYSNRIDLESNTMARNRGPSGYGIGLKDCDGVAVRANSLHSNRVGLYIDNSPSSIDSTGMIESNRIAHNQIGLLATPNTHNNVVTGNAFLDNEEQAASHGRGSMIGNRFARRGRGNFWSDYSGFDADGDGIGDMPYRPRSLFESLMARVPNLRVFMHSPAQRAVEFAARAYPHIRPEPKLTDPAPLVRPPRIEAGVPEDRKPAGPMAALSVGFLALASAGMAAIARDRDAARIARAPGRHRAGDGLP